MTATIPPKHLDLLFNPTPAAKQAKSHRHVPSIYLDDADRSLRLTMVDILRLFADRPEVRHFDDLRRLKLLPELENRVKAYVHAGGSLSFSTKNSFNLITPDAFDHVPGAKFIPFTDCIAGH
jgi:hypothetical protein